MDGLGSEQMIENVIGNLSEALDIVESFKTEMLETRYGEDTSTRSRMLPLMWVGKSISCIKFRLKRLLQNKLEIGEPPCSPVNVRKIEVTKDYKV